MSSGLPYAVCKHVFPSGRRCKAPALSGKPLCHHHTRSCSLTANNRYRLRSVGIPPLEDRAAIRMALDETIAAMLSNKISERKSGKLLWAIQIASHNLARAGEQPLAAADSVDLVEEHFDQVLVSDIPEEERAEAGPAVYAACQLPSLQGGVTHEFDPEPPPPAKKEKPRGKNFPFASRSAANTFYENGRQWLEEHYQSCPPPPADPPLNTTERELSQAAEQPLPGKALSAGAAPAAPAFSKKRRILARAARIRRGQGPARPAPVEKKSGIARSAGRGRLQTPQSNSSIQPGSGQCGAGPAPSFQSPV